MRTERKKKFVRREREKVRELWQSCMLFNLTERDKKVSWLHESIFINIFCFRNTSYISDFHFHQTTSIVQSTAWTAGFSSRNLIQKTSSYNYYRYKSTAVHNHADTGRWCGKVRIQLFGERERCPNYNL